VDADSQPASLIPPPNHHTRLLWGSNVVARLRASPLSLDRNSVKYCVARDHAAVANLEHPLWRTARDMALENNGRVLMQLPFTAP
jgi:hypothetical protein